MSSDPNAGARSVRPSGAETARKVLQVLLSFTEHRPTATVRELAEASGLPLPTAHRYVALLRELGLLEQSSRAGYQLGWRVLQLANAARATKGLFQIAEPVMRRLSAETDETVTLFQLAGEEEMVVVGQAESKQMVRLSFEPGMRLPLRRGASARLLMSSLPPTRRSEYVRRLAAEEPDLIGDPRTFERMLDRIRRQGYAESREELDPGIWAVSSPIVVGDQIVATLSVAGPLYRLEEGSRPRVLTQVTQAAGEVSEQLRLARAA